MENKNKPWRDLLFREAELVGFKQQAAEPEVYRFQNESTQFYIVNPIKTVSGPQLASQQNISAYRNIVVEFDGKMTEDEQRAFVDKNEMPFTIAVSSGNKSVHFIIGLQTDIDAESYKQLVGMVYAAMEGAADPKCKNVNRLTRTPGVVRPETGREQALIEARVPVDNTQLYSWLYYGPVRKRVVKHLELQEKRRAEFAAKQAEIAEHGKRAIPGIYRDIIEGGALHPETNSRHDTLVKLGIWLKHNGYDADEIGELLLQAEASLGIPAARQDANGVIRWLYGI